MNPADHSPLWIRGARVIDPSAKRDEAKGDVFALDGQDPRAPSPRTGPDRLYAPVGVVVTGAPVAASDDGKRMQLDMWVNVALARRY